MEANVDTYNASDIKYSAMSLLGRTDKPNFITSTEPDVQKINFLYPQIMYHTLERYRWGFARKYIQLTKMELKTRNLNMEKILSRFHKIKNTVFNLKKVNHFLIKLFYII